MSSHAMSEEATFPQKKKPRWLKMNRTDINFTRKK